MNKIEKENILADLKANLTQDKSDKESFFIKKLSMAE